MPCQPQTFFSRCETVMLTLYLVSFWSTPGFFPCSSRATFFVSACGMNVHHRCQTKVANLCGINQKLMAEALAMIESTQQVKQTLHWCDSRCPLNKGHPRPFFLALSTPQDVPACPSEHLPWYFHLHPHNPTFEIINNSYISVAICNILNSV